MTLPTYRGMVTPYTTRATIPQTDPMVPVSTVSSSASPPPATSRRRTTRKSDGKTVRFGRVPKREKAKILAAMQKVNASSQEKALCSELEDELRLLTTIVRAHEESSGYTKEKIAPLLEKARTHPVYAQCPPRLTCPLNPAPHHVENGGSSGIMETFSERFAPAINGVVEFAKKIPGFSFLSQDDQITLLKAGVFEVLLVRLACMFDSQANSLICLNGQVLHRESLHTANNARFLLDSMFDFAERLNALRLSDSEVGLFCAVVVIAPDRPGLRNTELVLKIQKKLMDILQKSVTANHPENPAIFGDLMKKIPDLRTLNTLHSEKLLAYKMEPHNQTPVSSGAVGLNGITNGSSMNSSIYATIPHEIWSQYSLVTTHPQCLTADEDNRSTSPGQQSQHGGSTTGSEWSTTDSKDEHDLIGSPRSVGSGLCAEDVKSPLRSSSFSSTRGSYGNEDMWPADASQNNEFHNIKRKRDNSGSEHGSSSGDECYYIDSPIKGPVYPKLRRVDSPTDSGIESGKEHGPSTTPTISVCSSPRSALDEKVKDIMDQEQEKQSQIEDMPVLKRALQAPPLVNTNMLMDEAYRHHKKFRAARRDVESPSSPGISLASTHSTLVRTLEQAPRYLSEQQLKRTDLIHNIIMRTETLPGQQQVSHHQTQPSHTEIPVQQQCGTNGIQVSVSGGCPYTSVPSSSPVPPNFAPNTQQKNMLVCPSGYYIPHANVSAPIYSTTPVSWSFVGGQSSASTITSTTVVTPSPMHVQTQFAVGEHSPPTQNGPVPVSHHQQSNAPVCSSVVTNSSVSPNLIYNCRSPSASSSPLVINGGLPSAPSPSGLPSICQLESRLVSSSPTQQHMSATNENGESQPLNLSKKLFTPPMLKMES